MVSWVPLDAAATVMLDICQRTTMSLPLVAHIVHPRPILWSEIMTNFAQVLNETTGKKLPPLSFYEWNEKVLQKIALCDRKLVHRSFPTNKLQTSLNTMAKTDQELRGGYVPMGGFEAFGLPRLATTVCEQYSSTLRDLPTLDCGDVIRWVHYWQRIGSLL